MYCALKLDEKSNKLEAHDTLNKARR